MGSRKIQETISADVCIKQIIKNWIINNKEWTVMQGLVCEFIHPDCWVQTAQSNISELPLAKPVEAKHY